MIWILSLLEVTLKNMTENRIHFFVTFFNQFELFIIL
jgi:hypothetical protein